MPKNNNKKNYNIQSNIIPGSKQDSSVNTFENQHCIQGLGELKGGHSNENKPVSSFTNNKQFLDAQSNYVPESNQDTSISTFKNQNSIQGS